MPLADLRKLGLAGCSNLLSRARRNARRLRSLSDFLSELSSAIHAESALAQTNYEVVSNMSSLITLPNELFTNILDCVVNRDGSLTNPARWKAALNLSHVNQYFRATALSCAQMWSNISGNADMVSSSLSRSKDVLLDVQLSVGYRRIANAGSDSYDLTFERFFAEVLPHSNRWRSLGIDFVPGAKDGTDGLRSISHKDVRDQLRGVDVRSLEKLDIKNKKDRKSSFKSYCEFENWNAPCLRRVVTSHYFPLSLPALAHVTHLNVTLDLDEINLFDLLKDLARMKDLEDLVLKLEARGPESADDIQFERLEETELPCVRHLRVETDDLRWGSVSHLKYLFSPLVFPRAVALSVILSGYVSKTYPEEDSAELYLCDEVECIFQHVAQFPQVEWFLLEVKGMNIAAGSGAKTVYQLEAEQGTIRAIVPLKMLPSLKHFTLCTNGSLSVSSLHGSGELVVHPAIETITIKAPSEMNIWGIVHFIRTTLEDQKSQSRWEDFRELVVMVAEETGDPLKEKITRRYGRDAALAWCKM